MNSVEFEFGHDELGGELEWTKTDADGRSGESCKLRNNECTAKGLPIYIERGAQRRPIKLREAAQEQL